MTMRSDWLHWAARIAQIGISVSFVFWILRFLDVAAIKAAIVHGNPIVMLSALAVIPLGWLVRSWRYKLIVSADSAVRDGRFTLWQSVVAFNLFLAGNAALPFRGGEWLRIAFFKVQYPRVSAAFLAGAAGTEKIPELIYAVSVVLVWLVLSAVNVEIFLATIVVANVVCFSLLIIFADAASRWWKSRESRWTAGRLSHPLLTNGLSFLERMAVSVRSLVSPRIGMRIVAATLCARALDSVIMLLVASYVDVSVSIKATIVIGAVLSLGLTVSAVPAHVGIFEAAVIAGAVMSGMNQNDSLVFAVAFHGLILVSWLFSIALAMPFVPQVTRLLERLRT